MAVTILPHDKGFYGTLGESIGGGLSQALVGIAEGKAEQYKRGQTAQGLAPYFGEKLAKQLAPFDPLILREIMKQKLQEPSRQAFAQAYQQMNGGGQQPSMQDQLLGGQEQMQQPEMMQGQQQPQGMIPGQEQQQGMQPQEQFQQVPQPAEMKREDVVALEQMRAQRSGTALKQQIAEEKKQQNIITANAPYKKRLAEKAEPSYETKPLISRARELLADPEIQIGRSNVALPVWSRNEKTQELNTLLNELVLKKAALMKGVPSKLRLELEKQAKAALWMEPEAIENIIDRIDEASNLVAREDSISNNIIERNNGNEPKNLRGAVQKIDKIQSALPTPKYDGFKIETERNLGKLGKRFVVVDGVWMPQ